MVFFLLESSCYLKRKGIRTPMPELEGFSVNGPVRVRHSGHPEISLRVQQHPEVIQTV